MQKPLPPDILFIIDYIVDNKRSTIDLKLLRERINTLSVDEKKELVRIMEFLIVDILHSPTELSS